MPEPPWMKLVERLKAKGHESRYLDRLYDRLPTLASLTTVGDVERELAQEMAVSLGRAADKVNVALLELELIGQEIDDLSARGGASRAQLAERVAAFNRQREVAKKYLWELKVQRECIGVRRWDDLSRDYPIPPEREA